MRRNFLGSSATLSSLVNLQFSCFFIVVTGGQQTCRYNTGENKLFHGKKFWFYNINVTASIASVPFAIDATPNDNTSIAVLCLPYDPNEKQVSPKGEGTQGYIHNGQELTYTIHFQNVGNAPAHHVRVEDVIDANLDLSTLEIISQSHPVELDAVNNQITFFFRDINAIQIVPSFHCFCIG